MLRFLTFRLLQLLELSSARLPQAKLLRNDDDHSGADTYKNGAGDIPLYF